MNFEEKLSLYAELIVRHGMNVQPDQEVYVGAETVHRDFITKIVKAAYRAGAKVVVVDFNDPRNTQTRILETKKNENLSFVPSFIPFRYEQMIPITAASVRVLGSEFPDLLENADPKKVNQVELGFKKSLKKFYEEGVGHSKVQWNVSAAATIPWAKKVFPELEAKEAYEALWDAIFRICRADKPDCLSLWKAHNERLATRAEKLTELKMEFLHFTGPGTDLKVGLSQKARFKGGNSYTPKKVNFEPNLPTEECFTTPDYRKTSGRVKTTRPFHIHGKLIKGLELEFKEGAIVGFEAKEGRATFAEYIESDPGAKRLGEVALVGIDSPIYQSGRIFEEILYDENAACHIALGFAYQFCVDHEGSMTSEELDQIGCNKSHVHTDMMISSEEVDVMAKLYSGKTVPLIKRGEWVEGW